MTAQSLTGTTGLVSIPTAEMPADGALTGGLNVLNRHYHGYGSRNSEPRDALAQYAGLGFLPFVEVGLRLTRKLNVPRQALGDRMVSVRVRALEEGAYTPAVVVGVHDLVGTRIFHSTYVVGSKHVDSVPVAGRVGVHLGYGGDWMKLDPRGIQFDGVFGGLSVEPRPWLTLIAEHDAERVNAGVRLRLFGRVTLLGAAHGMDAFSGGIAYTHALH